MKRNAALALALFACAPPPAPPPPSPPSLPPPDAAPPGPPAPPTPPAPPAPSSASAVAPEPLPPPHKPGFRLVTKPGKGACTTAADCVPTPCCMAQTCNAKKLEPACPGYDCVPLSGGFAGCTCEQGRCGGRMRYREDVEPTD